MSGPRFAQRPDKGWGGSPVPFCLCGHPDHRDRCGAVVGTSWCHCDRYWPETEAATAPDYWQYRW